MKNIKNKKTLAIIGAFIIIGAIGASYAFSSDRASMANDFALASYQTVFTDTFISPTNWGTCDTEPKSITVTNNSSLPVAVRVKVEESWLASDGTTALPLVSATSGLRMAIINETPNSGWTKKGSYYYYDADLAPGATTSSFLASVTLNCGANLSPDYSNSDSAYAGGEYHLVATAQTIQADQKDQWAQTLLGAVASQVNRYSSGYQIDFARKAIIADDEYTANGNGVNAFTEKGQTVYYFRGDVDNNNVIWADKCWKIIRTTYTGGTKMIYNGVPTDVNGARQCLATGSDTAITYNGANTFRFSNYNGASPADVGYMYGARVPYSAFGSGSIVFTFSNDVSRNGNTYTLDTSEGQSVTGTWGSQRINAATRYHYFCIDGSTSCDGSKIGYITCYLSGSWPYYISINGYDNIDALKAAMATNTTDSNAKAIVEAWFEAEGLDAHEDELEDAIFCNDRSFSKGTLAGKDSDGTPSGYTTHSTFGAYGRNYFDGDAIMPSLDCANQNDAFTKSDSVNGNAKLKHKVGLITADELTLAGSGTQGNDASAYLNSNVSTWTASPTSFDIDDDYADASFWYTGHFYDDVKAAKGFRPLVSLKAGTEFIDGTGAKTDPYIVE
jgi:hypothetical protein